MKLRSILFSCALVVASATAGAAATVNIGNVTQGASTTGTLAVRSLDFINFFVRGAGPAGLTVDISVTSTQGSNFREIFGLYSGSTLIAQSTRGANGGGGSTTLSFSGQNTLADGVYTLVVGAWNSRFATNISGVRSTAFFNNGSYTAVFAVPVSPVPLPLGGLLLIGGLGGLAMLRRKVR